MRKDKILAALLVALLLYSSFATWKWEETEKSRDNAINALERAASSEMKCFESSGILVSLAEENASNAALISFSLMLAHCAYNLESTAYSLRSLTNDPKYSDLAAFGVSLGIFFRRVENRFWESRELVLKNKDRLVNLALTIDNLTVERKGLRNLTPEDIKKLKKMAEEIESG
ncbi:hypothetical protein [Thermococcus gorgonarius]|uniref:Uncharacterized protein n=1 Tax=Thermococcus gorgonarius TaxID=71997 RepID=A0A2Z2M939_THEGO|nr:hypothetical protein [Thermococcus gorgonarius]ASJ00424.1 hypothetical protein A3K92_02460 [Thermococcus gorgonarius]